MSAFDKALNHAKNQKIDECEIVFSKRKITTIRITDSEISELKQNFDESYGIRLIHQKKIASAQTSNESNLEKVIDDAIKASSNLKPREFWKSLPFSIPKMTSITGTFDHNLGEISGSDASDLAQQMINSTLNDKIDKISGSLNIVFESFEISNSNGLELTDRGTHISGIINADSEAGDTSVSGIGHHCCRTLDKFNPELIGNEAKTMCLESINPQKCIDDTYTIIFEPYCIAEILAFVMSLNFNLKTFSEKRSCFSEKFQQNIAVEDFTLIDDPHYEQGLGSKSFDDEGIETQPNSLIKNGRFNGLFSDLFDSFKEEKETSGNASRPGSPMGRSSLPIPISVPHNLRVEEGDFSQQEMINDTKHGLLVGRLWYTYAVNPIKGDFSCTARSGIRIIENGEIKDPGKPVRIIHNIKTLLQNISSVGNNARQIIPWASLPSITPSLKIEGIRVNSI